MKLAVSGCHGRMGKSISRLALEDDTFELSTLLEHKDHPQLQEKVEGRVVETESSALEGNDILIEFTSPEATIAHLIACLKYKVKMVIGTTGFSEEQIKDIESAASTIPIVFASNMSIGVNLLFKLTQLTAHKTAEKYTMDITETHHIHKKDAPSGTAKTLAKLAEDSSGQKVHNIESIREGEVIGDHSITFESDEDIITVSHHAKNRDIFAKGALVAAKFLQDKKNGLFNMQDVLDLN